MTTMNAPSTPVVPERKSLVSQVAGNRRFLIAVGLLVCAIVGWYVLVWWLGFALDKQPVPWPDGPNGVVVDKDFQMTSFPEMFPAIGPKYMLLSSRRWEHPIPEREAIMYLPEDTRLELGIGRSSDAPRRVDRKSNWYLSRKYGDVRPQGVNGIHFWHLDITYYTGAADLVAHVPGRCMVAAGATPLGDKLLTWDLPDNALGWKTARVVRSVFQSTDPQGQQSNVVQYYTFSINGRNEHDWKKIRLTLTADVRQKYVYFGKIQFAPLAPNIENLDAADEAARQFFAATLVEAAWKFPAADTVEALNQSFTSSKSSN